MQDEALAVSAQAPARVGRFERLPKWLNLIPMIVQWAWLGLRHGSLTLPSSANPGITSGGMVGDGKLEYFAAMGPLARSATATHIGIAHAADVDGATIESRMATAGLAYPIVAKPDLGWCGYGVRLLQAREDLDDYLRRFPHGETFLLQRYLPEPGEAGLFYMRSPEADSGQLIGILLRHYPSITGNGRDRIAALIERDARLRRGTSDAMHQGRYDPDHVLASGETLRLSTVASTRVGGAYEDGTDQATRVLTARVDAIAKDMGEFLVGRFDVRYRSLAALRQGEFTIMEVNGAGSEAVHAWDPRYTIRDVYRIVFAKQRALFRIAAQNRARGYRPIGALALARLHLHQQRTMRRYPPSN